ncbi:glycosyltransferase family 39 protein [Candidatus Parcubacteria bacterium]|nr:glycosyltransferase family 39 protein [Candidatus Parcubacteria bacterium]
MNKYFKIFFILAGLLIISWGIFIRFYQINDTPYWMDEGYTVNAVISGMENGHNNLASILDSGKTYFCPIYCYPTEFIVKIFDNTPLAFRLLSAIAGIIFIFIIFFFAKNLFGWRAAFLSSFFITFSYSQIAWSRQARWYTLLSVFFWLALFFFYKLLYNKRKKILNGSLVFLFTLLAILTHHIAILLPLIMLGWIVVEIILSKNKSLLKYLATGSVFTIFLVLILKFVFGITFIEAFLNKISLHYNLPYYLSFYLRNYWLLIIFSVLAVFSFQNKKKIYFMLLPIFAYLILLSFFTNIVHYRYLFHITPAIYILASVAILDFFGKIRYIYLKYIFISAVILAFFISNGAILPRSFYLLESDDPDKLGQRPHYAYTPQPDFNSAYAVIENNLKNNEIVISSHPHFNKIFLNRPGYWLKYDYLGIEDNVSAINEDREYYVGAKVIDDLKELKQIMQNNHGCAVFDFMSIDNRIPKNEIDYITNNSELIFNNKINSYSEIWVYKF